MNKQRRAVLTAPDHALRRKLLPLSVIAAMALTSIAPGIAFAQQASGSFQGLGFLGGVQGPFPFTVALGVNADGSVVVGYGSGSAAIPEEAFSYTAATGPVGLGFLAGTSPTPISVAFGVNADGSVIVGYSAISAGQDEAFRYTTATGMVGLGYLIGANTATASSYAEGVNADGSVVVGESTNAANQSEAFSYTAATGMLGLGFIGGGGLGPYSVATAVNADGTVVVGQGSNAANQGEAFRYTAATGMLGLGFIGGGGLAPYSVATAVNADGTVVVGQGSNAADQNEAFRYTAATGMTGLGFIGGGGSSPFSYASGVSADGSIVVGESSNAANQDEAFRYTAATGIQSLAGLLTAAGVNLNGFMTLAEANAVSANGQFIVGQGTDAAGHTEAYVARYVVAAPPPPPPPPPPPSPPPPTPPPTPPPPPVGGVTTAASVHASVNQLATARRLILVQEFGLAAQMLGADERIGSGSELGVFAAGGTADSLDGGGSFRVAYGNGFTLLGGVNVAREHYTNVRADDVFMGALALRYVFDTGNAWRPYAEAGGWYVPHASFTFSRSYANGAGTAIGSADTDGHKYYVYGRFGGVFAPSTRDEAALSVEIGRAQLHTDAFAEAFSAADPFEASGPATTDNMTIGKLRGQWTHTFNGQIDATVWAAAARSFNESNDLLVAVPGFGIQSPDKVGHPMWAEYGGRIGYKMTPNATVDVFAGGISGDKGIGTDVHIGARFRYSF